VESPRAGVVKQDNPTAQIAAGNPWYVADQHRSQLGSRGRRRVIEFRWRRFGEMMAAWYGARRHTGTVTVLDAGCGDGINLLGLRQIAGRHHLPMRLVGVDYNPVRITRARAIDGDVHLQRGTLYDLPFGHDRFDVVLCNHVIEHVPDTRRVLAELYRVLRPGGLLIVGVPNEGCLMGRVRNRFIQPGIGRETDHVHFFTAASVSQALQAAGFRIQRIARETFFFPCSYVNACCNEFGAGHWVMAGLRALIPSQAGGLIVASEKPSGSPGHS